MNGPEHITNVTNYSGIFETGVSYKKFDFVYNTGDSRFYYAKEDMQYGGSAIMEGANRFYIEPDGPQGANGLPTHYIHDEINELTTLNNQVEPGHTIHLTGTINNADGYYNVLQVERDISLKLKEDEIYSQSSDGTVDGALDSTDLALPGFRQSDWFIYANKGTNQELDARNYYVPQGTAEGWIYHLLLGWIFVSPHAIDESIWFWVGEEGSSQDTSDLGNWIFTSTNSLGSMVPTRDSFMFIDGARPNSSSRFGPVDNWIHWQKSHDAKYAAIVYNYGSQRWYGLLSDFSTEILDVSFVAPALVTETLTTRRSDGQVTRIQIQGVDENTKIEVTERPSDNFISIKSIVQDLSSDNTFWSKDSFFFDADYGSSVSFKANNYKYEYGNGYYTLQPKSVNALSFQADLQFKNRTNREANAIMHFLENHQGQHEKDSPGVTLKYNQGISGFKWDGNATFHPYDSLSNQSKDFYCSNFSHSLNFENSNDLNITLTNFNTSLLRKSEELFTKHPGDYDENQSYSLNDVVFETGSHQYYYCHTGDGTQFSLGNPPIEEAQEWTREYGDFKEVNSHVWTREFFWNPSLGLEVTQNPRLLNMTLGGGYNQVYRDGINESLLELNLQFNNRSDEEAYAILHFLEQHYGAMPFQFCPPAPYEFKKNFVCQEWNHTYNYKNNHSITAKFEEFPINLSSQKLINNATPSPTLPAEILMKEFVTMATPEDSLLWKTNQRKRIIVENVGGENANVDSLSFLDGDYYFSILGKTSLGETYRPTAIDGSEDLTDTNIESIYQDIMGTSIDADTKTKYLNNFGAVQGWKTENLIESIFNSTAFLQQAPDQRLVNILYLDLLNREVGGSEDISSLLAQSTVSDVVTSIQESGQYKEIYNNDVKLLPRRIRGANNIIVIPDHKLIELELNGVAVSLDKYENGLQTFTRIDNGQRYTQYSNGSIQKAKTDSSSNQAISDGSSAIIAANYFVIDKYIKKNGSNVIDPFEESYIDIMFGNPDESITNSYLADHEGNELSWSNVKNTAMGSIKVASTDTWIYGNIKLIWDTSNEIKTEIKTWIVSEPSKEALVKLYPWYEGVNDLYQDYLTKSLELIPAPRINFPVQLGKPTDISATINASSSVFGGDLSYQTLKECGVPVLVNYTIWTTEANNISDLTDLQRGNIEGAYVDWSETTNYAMHDKVKYTHSAEELPKNYISLTDNNQGNIPRYDENWEEEEIDLAQISKYVAEGYLPDSIIDHDEILNELQIKEIWTDITKRLPSQSELDIFKDSSGNYDGNAKYVIDLVVYNLYKEKILYNNITEIELDFISDSAKSGVNKNTPDFFKGMWASYEIKLYSTEDGGILLPRELANENVNEISGWKSAEDLMILGPIYDQDHTVYEISNSSDESYSKIVTQKGMCKLSEAIRNDNDEIIGYKAKAKIRTVGNFSLNGQYKKGGAGNLEITIHDFVAKYGIVRIGTETTQAPITMQGAKQKITDFRTENATLNGSSNQRLSYFVKLRNKERKLTGEEVNLFEDDRDEGFKQWVEENDRLIQVGTGGHSAERIWANLVRFATGKDVPAGMPTWTLEKPGLINWAYGSNVKSGYWHMMNNAEAWIATQIETVDIEYTRKNQFPDGTPSPYVLSDFKREPLYYTNTHYSNNPVYINIIKNWKNHPSTQFEYLVKTGKMAGGYTQYEHLLNNSDFRAWLAMVLPDRPYPIYKNGALFSWTIAYGTGTGSGDYWDGEAHKGAGSGALESFITKHTKISQEWLDGNSPLRQDNPSLTSSSNIRLIRENLSKESEWQDYFDAMDFNAMAGDEHLFLGLYDLYIRWATREIPTQESEVFDSSNDLQLDVAMNMWRLNGTFVPDVPDFIEYMQINFSDGIQLPPPSESQAYYDGGTWREGAPKWNAYVSEMRRWSDDTYGVGPLNIYSVALKIYAEMYGNFVQSSILQYQPYWYNVVDQSGEIHFAGYKDIQSAVFEWNRLRNENFQYRQVVAESIDSDLGIAEFKKSCHFLSCNAVYDAGTFSLVLDQDSKDNLSALNAAYAGLPRIGSTNGSWDYLYYGAIAQPLPRKVTKSGLKINSYLYVDLTDEQERELNLAIELVENIILDDICVDIFFSEGATTRLGGSYNESEYARAESNPDKDWLPGGLSNGFSRPLRGVVSINPKFLFDFDFNKDVDESYEPNQLSGFYYTMLHEILHIMGIGQMWFKDSGYSLRAYANQQAFLSHASDPDRKIYWEYIDSGNPSFLNKYALIGLDSISEISVSTTPYSTFYLGAEGNAAYQALCLHKGFTHLQPATRNSFNNPGTTETYYYYTTNMPVGPSYNTVPGIDGFPVNHVGEEPQELTRSGNRYYLPSVPNALMALYNDDPSTPTILSAITMGMLKDLGYTVDESLAESNDDIYLNVT